MKKLRKLTSLLLAAVLMLSMGIAVFAVNPVTTSAADTGTITINSTTKDQTYSIYKIFDLTYDSDSESYSYTISSDWVDFFTNNSYAGSTYVNVTKVTTTEGTTYYATWETTTDTVTMQAFATAALNYAAAENISATATTIADDRGTVTFSGLALGYYLVQSSLGTLISLDSTDNTATVVDKNAKPTITKEVSASEDVDYSGTSTAEFTDTVYYKVTIKGINELTDLTLHDVLPTGFTFVGVTKVLLYSSSSDTNPLTLSVDASKYDYTVATSCSDECSFEVDFSSLLTNDYNNYYATKVTDDNAYIEVYYKATITSSAVTGSTGNTNTAWLYHSDTKSVEVTTITYIYDFYVYKYTTETSTETVSGTEPTTATETEVPLSGAEFILYYKDGNITYYAKFDEYGNFNGWTSANDKDSAIHLSSDTNGFIHISGLDVGTYYLEEVVAPSGYALLSAATTVTISADATTNYIATVTNTTEMTYNSSTVSAVKVKNSTNSAMPTTGGVGTTSFYVVGLILVLGTLILLITRKRMNNAAK